VIEGGLSSEIWWGLIPMLVRLFGAPGIYGLVIRTYWLLTGPQSELDSLILDGDEVRRHLRRALLGSCLVVVGIVVVLYVVAWWDVH